MSFVGSFLSSWNRSSTFLSFIQSRISLSLMTVYLLTSPTLVTCSLSLLLLLSALFIIGREWICVISEFCRCVTVYGEMEFINVGTQKTIFNNVLNSVCFNGTAWKTSWTEAVKFLGLLHLLVTLWSCCCWERMRLQHGSSRLQNSTCNWWWRARTERNRVLLCWMPWIGTRNRTRAPSMCHKFVSRFSENKASHGQTVVDSSFFEENGNKNTQRTKERSAEDKSLSMIQVFTRTVTTSFFVVNPMVYFVFRTIVCVNQFHDNNKTNNSSFSSSTSPLINRLWFCHVLFYKGTAWKTS